MKDTNFLCVCIDTCVCVCNKKFVQTNKLATQIGPSQTKISGSAPRFGPPCFVFVIEDEAYGSPL